jgi:hypothetical protein
MDQNNQMIVRPNGSGVARSGFGEQSMEARPETSAVAVAERARAEVQARFIIALQRPRDIEQVRRRILAHCTRPGFATKARYKKPVGQSSVEGPSIRFVETALAEYGNVHSGSTVTYEDDEKLIVCARVTDLERNDTHEAEAVVRKTVERNFLRDGMDVVGQRVNTRGKVTYLIRATDDDLANKKAAAESKLIRNLGLRILPADIVDEAQAACMATLVGDAGRDLGGRSKDLAAAFAAIKVTAADLEHYLGHALAAITADEIAELRLVYAALRDGEGTWADALSAKTSERADDAPAPQAAPPAQARGNAAAKEAIRRRQQKVAPPVQVEKVTSDEQAEIDAMAARDAEDDIPFGRD